MADLPMSYPNPLLAFQASGPGIGGPSSPVALATVFSLIGLELQQHSGLELQQHSGTYH